MKVTRRKWAAAALAPAIALAQTQPVPATPDDELKAARDRIKANSNLLAQQKVPMDLEPAVVFKA